MTVRTGYDMGSPAAFNTGQNSHQNGMPFYALAGWMPNTRHPMQIIEVKLSTAVTISVFMRDANTNQGKAGLTLSVNLKKSGGSFASISPTITDRGSGWYDVALTSGNTDTLGIACLRVTANAAIVGQPSGQENNECQLNVIAIDKQDSVRMGLSALPNSAAGTLEGVALSEQVANIAVTGAALNQTAASRTITSGSGSGGVVNTTQADAVFDTISDSAGAIDFYYQFDLSGTTSAVGVGVQWTGYIAGLINSMKVYAWNWVGSSWDQVATVAGIAGTVVGVEEWELTSAHTGTGGNIGLVRLRFANTGLTAASVKTDRILLGYVVTPATSSTIAGSVWDSVRSGHRTAGTFGEVLPDAASGAVGGLATITAIGQGPGGVLKPNSMEDNMVYSAGKLASSRLRVFATSSALASAIASHADNTDGEVERYVSAVTYNGDGTVASFKWTKQL